MILIFLIILIISSYFITHDFMELRRNEESTQKLIENSVKVNRLTEESIDWNYLKSVNEDIIGWIKIENTKINYPVLKDNNLYYINHSYDKKYNKNGCIFTTNDKPFEDEETIIYGHNMKNGSMFSELSKYLDKDFCNSHINLKIYTPTVNYEGTIFSSYSIGIELENGNIKNKNFNERIKYYKNTSKYTINNIDNITKIVKLSTCSYVNANTSPTDQRCYVIVSIIPIK